TQRLRYLTVSVWCDTLIFKHTRQSVPAKIPTSCLTMGRGVWEVCTGREAADPRQRSPAGNSGAGQQALVWWRRESASGPGSAGELLCATQVISRIGQFFT